jgi:ornithine carbamoyltransferase
MTAMEVTDEVFESPAPIVFDHSEISGHSIPAVMPATAVHRCAS